MIKSLATTMAAFTLALAPIASADQTYELRVYTAAEGKLDELHARFANHTIALFEKHGMTVVGFWTPTDEEGAKNTLVYLLAYPDAEARGTMWRAFATDPDWQAAYAKSRENGPLISNVESTMMAPTAYSGMK